MPTTIVELKFAEDWCFLWVLSILWSWPTWASWDRRYRPLQPRSGSRSSSGRPSLCQGPSTCWCRPSVTMIYSVNGHDSHLYWQFIDASTFIIHVTWLAALFNWTWLVLVSPCPCPGSDPTKDSSVDFYANRPIIYATKCLVTDWIGRILSEIFFTGLPPVQTLACKVRFFKLHIRTL